MKLVLLIIPFLLFSCTRLNLDSPSKPTQNQSSLEVSKMNGVSFVAMNNSPISSNFTPVQNINATWIAAMPFGFIKTDEAKVQYNTIFQWEGEKKEGIIHTIKLAHENNIKVMVKPHLWIHDKWVGDLNFTSETDWVIFEKTYSNYILDYAKLSDSMKAETFCIGVELKQVVKNRPLFWSDLIDKVKSVYSGKITYAANWDNYQNVKFWDKLDYIGIDAYFPISEEKTPTLQACLNGWKNNFNAINKLSTSINKNVIFTEFGYRNVDYSGKEPWDDTRLSTYNSKGQENTYKALFSKFWKEPWFEGGFLWKWYPNHTNAGGLKNNRFTPQNKPVENLIKSIYSQTK